MVTHHSAEHRNTRLEDKQHGEGRVLSRTYICRCQVNICALYRGMQKYEYNDKLILNLTRLRFFFFLEPYSTVHVLKLLRHSTEVMPNLDSDCTRGFRAAFRTDNISTRPEERKNLGRTYRSVCRDSYALGFQCHPR